jgi:hypothetical protein
MPGLNPGDDIDIVLNWLFHQNSQNSIAMAQTTKLSVEKALEKLRGRTRLLLGVGESGFENVADRLPRAAVELNQAQVLDRPKVTRSGADFDSRQQD